MDVFAQVQTDVGVMLAISGAVVFVVILIALPLAIGYRLRNPPKCKWCGEKDAVYFNGNDGYCEEHRYEKDRK